MQRVSEQISKLNPLFRDRSDALAFFCHCALLDEGFTACDETWTALRDDDNNELQLSQKWNSDNTYCFHYTHGRSSHNFLVRMAVMFDKLVVLCSSAQEKVVSTTSLNIDEFTVAGTPEQPAKYYTNPERLRETVTRELARKLVPQTDRDITKPAMQRPDHLLSEREKRLLEDPHGVRGDYGAFSVGRGDLDGFYGGDGIGGAGGNLMGPGHPAFRGGVGVGPGRRLGPGARPPPGARFDPYGPDPHNLGPGLGGSGMGSFTHGVPDPDGLQPPGGYGYNGMFM